MVNSHACISTYLQIDQDTSSRRDDSSTKHVSNHFEIKRMSILLSSCRKYTTNGINSEERDNKNVRFLFVLHPSENIRAQNFLECILMSMFWELS